MVKVVRMVKLINIYLIRWTEGSGLCLESLKIGDSPLVHCRNYTSNSIILDGRLGSCSDFRYEEPSLWRQQHIVLYHNFRTVFA